MFIRSMLSAGIVASALIGTAATAAADLPNCTAGDLAGVMSGVNAGMSVYLFTHPDVNDFFTSLKGMSREEMRTARGGSAEPTLKLSVRTTETPAR